MSMNVTAPLTHWFFGWEECHCFESAFAGVRKRSSPEEEFAALEHGIRDMPRRYPLRR